LEASAAVNRQIRAALSSWLVSDRKRFQTRSGRSKFLDSSDFSLPVVTIWSLSQSNRRPRLNFGAACSSTSGISTPRKAFARASTIGPSRQTVSRFAYRKYVRRLNRKEPLAMTFPPPAIAEPACVGTLEKRCSLLKKNFYEQHEEGTHHKSHRRSTRLPLLQSGR
jgi:hypothetical protein